MRIGRAELAGPDGHVVGEESILAGVGRLADGETGALVSTAADLFYQSQVSDVDHHYAYADQGSHSGSTKDLLGSTIPRTISSGPGGSVLQLGFSDNAYFSTPSVFAGNAPSLRPAEATGPFASF